MESDHTAEVEVGFAEDLSYSDVAPILDAFAATPIFTVRGKRVAWSGPAAGGPEVGIVLTAIATVGGGAYVATFCAELAKDTYKAVRAAIIGVVRGLRDQDPERRRAVVALSIRVQQVELCVGPLLEREPRTEEWTDEWFVDRLLRAQAIIEERGGKPRTPSDLTGPTWQCEEWLE